MTQEDKIEDWAVKRYQELAGDYSTNANASIRILVEELLSSQRQLLVEKYKDALIWCGGSEDFQVGGKAREGWEKIVVPLLQSSLEDNSTPSKE